VDVATGKVDILTSGSLGSTSPFFSDEGDRVAYQVARDGLWAFQWNASVKDLSNGSEVRIAPEVDRDFSAISWTPTPSGSSKR
jgi:hypothetical protein